MKKIKELYIKYKEIINYLIFGVLTTLINFIAFFIFNKLNVELLINNVLSWIIAVTFAYITNKIFVFESKTSNKIELFKEIILFYSCRIFSLLVEEAMLFILVQKMGINEYIIKIIAQIVIIIMNYLLSKLIAFKNKGENDEKN